jgi:hypothetical protein
VKIKKLSIALICTLLISSCDLENTGGVLTANQLPQSVIDFVEDKNILEDEYIIAYYDVTITLNNSESAILTDKNLIYYKSGNISKMRLNEISFINVDNDCFGVCITATSPTDVMRIEIAPLNDGEVFADLLNSSYSKI